MKKWLALLLAGSFFFCCGFSRGRVKAGVCAEGVEIGGLTYADAARAVREKIAEGLPPLIVHTPAGEVRFSEELSFRDDLSSLLPKAKKGEVLHVCVERTWATAEADLGALCEQFCRAGKDAALTFSSAGFSYTHEQNALVCDGHALLRDALSALSTGEEVTLRVYERPPAVTEELLRARTRPLSSYTTYFSASNAPRAANIRLSAERISGTVIPPGGEFSFNRTVGKRTAENGFREAPVIFGGEFVQGIGGGVCQTSTTLFNAALRAGMAVKESRAHSLSVGYVPPSLDAMVSESSDMRFVNPRPYPVYLLAEAGKNFVRFKFYGMPDGRRYETESVVLLRVAPPPEQIVEGETDGVIRAAKEGVMSESFLLVYEGETLLSRTLIRRDKYASVQGIRRVAPAREGEEEGEIPPAEGEDERNP